ncbi:MAG: AAA family ATPase [Eubacteriales bacterium]|nr:AAA family ATPase [Eubacteriales bacterium]
MRFEEIKIEAFGALVKRRLTLAQGLNIIYGKNESGKSSIAAFIYAAFYGFPRKQRSLERDLRRRYRPWHADDYGGRIRYLEAGRRYELRRSFAQQNRLDTVHLIDSENARELRLQNSDAPGEEILALKEEEFLTACFVLDRLAGGFDFKSLQSSIAERSLEDYSGELWQKLRRELEAERRELKPFRGPGGALEEVEAQLLALDTRYRAAILEEERQADLAARIKAIEAEIAAYEQGAEAFRIRENLAQARAFSERYAAYLRLEDEFEESLQEKAGADLKEGNAAAFSARSGHRLSVLEVDEFAALDKRFNDSHKDYLLRLDESADLQFKLQQLEAQLQQLEAARAKAKRQLLQAEKAYQEANLESRKAEISELKKEQFESRRSSSNLGFNLFSLGLSMLSFILAIVFDKWQFLLGGLALVFALLTVFLFWRSAQIAKRAQRELEERQQIDAKKIDFERGRLEDFRARELELKWKLEQSYAAIDEKHAQALQATELAAEAKRKFSQAKRDYLYFLERILGRKPDDSELGELYVKIVKTSLSGEQTAREKAEWEQRKAELLQGLSEAEFKLRAAEARSLVNELEAKLAKLGQHGLEFPAGEHAELKLSRLKREQADLGREMALSLAQDESAAAIALELEDLELKHSKLSREVEIYDLALKLGDNAERELRQRAVPSLIKASEKYFRDLTEGRYQALLQSEAGEIKLGQSGASALYSEAYYSEGTRDLLELALRLAFGDLLQKKSRTALVLILDDPLLRLDQERKIRAFKFLSDYALRSGRQLIYLTADESLEQLAKQAQLNLQYL